MAILPLPLKYRPQQYADLIGQEMTVRFLQALSVKRIGRNIILHGQFGSGKTSSARIYAKALNCMSLSETGDPCYECDACKDSSNVIELDAASFSGKEDVKNLLEAAKVPPLLGKYKVVIADEAQQFSRAAWDALLKSIEEPKAHQVFIFSTTELDKVRDAIKSRCQCLEVKLISAETAKQHLKKICNIEGFSYEEPALDIISFMSKGHPRDLLKNLEQVSFLGDITIENTKIIFNLGYLTHLLTLVKKITSPDTVSFREALMLFEESPKNIVEVVKQIHLYFYYFCIHKARVEINPAFALLQGATLSQLWQNYENVLGESIAENLLKVMAHLNTIQDTSILSVEIGLLELHSLIHKKRFDANKKEEAPTLSVQSPAGARKRRGRQFHTIGETNPLLPVAPPLVKEEPVVEEGVPDKIYPHTLLKLGLQQKTITEDNMVVLTKGIECFKQ